MTENQFWTLISKIDFSALKSGADDDAVQPLIETLAECQGHEIEQFEELLAQHLYALDGQVYADCAGQSGQSADGFLYARCFVVASGKKFYELVQADPTRFPSSIDDWCESLLYVARQAWAEATGEDEDDWAYTPTVDYETGSNKSKWTT